MRRLDALRKLTKHRPHNGESDNRWRTVPVNTDPWAFDFNDANCVEFSGRKRLFDSSKARHLPGLALTSSPSKGGACAPV